MDYEAQRDARVRANTRKLEEFLRKVPQVSPFQGQDIGDAVEAFLHGVAERGLFGRERGGVQHFLHYQGVVEAAFTTAAILTTVLKKFFEFTLPAVRRAYVREDEGPQH